jgi:hypothetical protein
VGAPDLGIISNLIGSPMQVFHDENERAPYPCDNFAFVPLQQGQSMRILRLT